MHLPHWAAEGMQREGSCGHACQLELQGGRGEDVVRKAGGEQGPQSMWTCGQGAVYWEKFFPNTFCCGAMLLYRWLAGGADCSHVPYIHTYSLGEAPGGAHHSHGSVLGVMLTGCVVLSWVAAVFTNQKQGLQLLYLAQQCEREKKALFFLAVQSLASPPALTVCRYAPCNVYVLSYLTTRNSCSSPLRFVVR